MIRDFQRVLPQQHSEQAHERLPGHLSTNPSQPPGEDIFHPPHVCPHFRMPLWEA